MSALLDLFVRSFRLNGVAIENFPRKEKEQMKTQTDATTAFAIAF
jgi:hypothetical protein